MSTEIARIPLRDDTDLSHLGLTQSETGHVHSPWFTYDYVHDMAGNAIFHGFDNGWRRLLDRAISAFASQLNIPRDAVIVTERDNRALNCWDWRLGTRCATPLPKRALPQPPPSPPALPRDKGYIDI